MGKLYVVGTPIGNLEDITLRAARVLGEVSLVAAEDTRVSRRLLNHLDIRVPCLSCNEHNWRQRLPELLRVLGTGDVALVTDAGMPAVSDPGAEVVSAVARRGHRRRGNPRPLGGHHRPGPIWYAVGCFPVPGIFAAPEKGTTEKAGRSVGPQGNAGNL